jgi:GNAT superfamily N-acetyltransferase
MVCSDELRVRPALRSDREFLFEVRRAALRAYVEQTSGWDDAEQRVTADKEFAELPFAVVEENGLAVGYVCVIHESEYDFIEEVALLPEAQGRGIGTHLLRGILLPPNGAAFRSSSASSSAIPHRPSMAASGSTSCGSSIRGCRCGGFRAMREAKGRRTRASEGLTVHVRRRRRALEELFRLGGIEPGLVSAPVLGPSVMGGICPR